MVRARRLVFSGHIAGFGTEAGVRMVVGAWEESPFGRFADVMVESADGERTLLAPTSVIAEFVSQTYTFDRIELGEVDVRRTAEGSASPRPASRCPAASAVPRRSTGCSGWYHRD